MVKLRGRNFQGKYTKLRHSYIVGYIDHFDVVHSRIFSTLQEDGYEETKTHVDLFGMVLRAWRWDYDRGLDFTIHAKNMTTEDCDLIREHLINEYDIPFYSNGFHDVSFFCQKMDEEDLQQ